MKTKHRIKPGFCTNSIDEKCSSMRANFFLAAGCLCHITVAVLLFFRNSKIFSLLQTRLVCFKTGFADNISAVLSAAIAILTLLSAFWIYCYLKRKKLSGCIQPPSRFSSFIRLSLLSFLFIFSLFPLDWTSSFSRSHDSALHYYPFDFILILTGLAGIVFFLLFFFLKLPPSIVKITNRYASRFFDINESLLLLFCAAACLLLTCLFSHFALENIPHVQDSIAQLFQAKIFKTGALTAPVPSHKEFFEYMNIINSNQWYSQYPPGHPLLLLIGLFLRAAWIINPLLGTFSLILLYKLARECYGEKVVSYLSIVFLLFSPFFLFMSSSYMNHVSTMFFLLLFIYSYAKLLKSPSWHYPLVCGLSLGFATNIRPLTAFAMALPFCLDFLLDFFKKQKHYFKKLLCFTVGLSMMLLLLLIYNYLTNSSPFIFGYQVKYNTAGFLGSAQIGPPHTLMGGIKNTSNNLTALNKYLFEWPIPSLLFIFVLFLPGIKRNRWDRLFLLSFLSVAVFYFFYYYQDLCFGPRFFYSTTPLLILLTIRGILKLPAIMSDFSFNRYKVSATVCLFLFLCFTYTVACSIPLLFNKYSSFYWYVDDSLHKTVTEMKIKNAIVFIDVMYPPGNPIPNLPVYGSGFLYNSPGLKDSVIYAINRGAWNTTLMREYPGRDYFLWKFSPETNDFKLSPLVN